MEEWPQKYLRLPLGGNPNKYILLGPNDGEGLEDGMLEKNLHLTGQENYVDQGCFVKYLDSTCPFSKFRQRSSKPFNKFKRISYGKVEMRRRILGKWSRVCNPKKLGGLRMGHLKERNLALLGKWL